MLEPKPPTLAEFLEGERKARKFRSQRAFAREANIDPKTMNRILNGHIPDPEQLVTMAEHLNLDPLNLLALAYLPPQYNARRSRLVREIVNLLDKMNTQQLDQMVKRVRFEFEQYINDISS